MELIYSLKELEDIIKNIEGVKLDKDRVKIETNFCFSTENNPPKIILDLCYNYTHRGEGYYKLTPKIYDSYCYYEHSTKITWSDNTTSQITWPDSASCTDLYDYFNKLKTMAENVSKRRTLALKKQKVKEKIFEIESEESFGKFNELVEQLNAKNKNIKFEKLNTKYDWSFGELSFTQRPKLKVWDIEVPYNRDYKIVVNSLDEVYQFCEWWYNKPVGSWKYKR